MKFVDALYTSEKMIQRLMTAVVVLAMSTAGLMGIVIYFSTKPAVVIDRSCDTKIISQGSGKRTTDEINAFISEAMSVRFDTDRNKPSLMTEAQADMKSKELKELRSRKIYQRVFVDEVILKGDGSFTAKLTRLIKVENIRTALVFSIDAKIFEDARSEDNPYGLILSEVKLVESEEKK